MISVFFIKRMGGGVGVSAPGFLGFEDYKCGEMLQLLDVTL